MLDNLEQIKNPEMRKEVRRVEPFINSFMHFFGEVIGEDGKKLPRQTRIFKREGVEIEVETEDGSEGRLGNTYVVIWIYSFDKSKDPESLLSDINEDPEDCIVFELSLTEILDKDEYVFLESVFGLAIFSTEEILDIFSTDNVNEEIEKLIDSRNIATCVKFSKGVIEMRDILDKVKRAKSKESGKK